MSKDPTDLPNFDDLSDTTELDLTDLPLFRDSSPAVSDTTNPTPRSSETTTATRSASALAGPVQSPKPAPAVGEVIQLRPATPPPPPMPPPTPAPAPAPSAASTKIALDWKQVAMFRGQASDQLTAVMRDDRSMSKEAMRERGRQIILDLLQSEAEQRLSEGDEAWPMDVQEAMSQAIFDALFGLGRLEPLVRDDSLENILITGHDTVHVERTDGMLIKVDPVADSDEELTDFLSFTASRSESNAREFSSAKPRLHMRLDGGSRLAAAAWTTARPSVVIRRHRLRKINLGDLIDRNMITPVMASFLDAAVKARKSIVVAGPQGAGKTTLVRALCAAINPWEAIGTFETEFELHLHELPEIHPIVHAWEARPGTGEVGPDGRQAGEFTLDEALFDSFRFNLSRQIVGEVRGKEVWAMIKAMESGTGSISTTHAGNAEGAVRKLVTCAMEGGPHITRELATSKLAETVDLVVQVHLQTVPEGQDVWRRDRWVSEIIAISPGEHAKGYATTHVFTPNPVGGPAVPATLPEELRALQEYGFDLTTYLGEASTDGGA